MKEKFRGFKKCMAMMRSRNPGVREDGFHWLRPHAEKHLQELIDEFEKETDFGLKCWLLELIGETRMPDAFQLLASQLRSNDRSLRIWAIRGLQKIDTKEAQTLLWEARGFEFTTPQETADFRSDLGSQ